MLYGHDCAADERADDAAHASADARPAGAAHARAALRAAAQELRAGTPHHPHLSTKTKTLLRPRICDVTMT